MPKYLMILHGYSLCELYAIAPDFVIVCARCFCQNHKIHQTGLNEPLEPELSIFYSQEVDFYISENKPFRANFFHKAILS